LIRHAQRLLERHQEPKIVNKPGTEHILLSLKTETVLWHEPAIQHLAADRIDVFTGEPIV